MGQRSLAHWQRPEVEGNIFIGRVYVWDDPAFVDPDEGNYHIKHDSAAVDAGVDAGVDYDIDGDDHPFDGDHDGVDEFDIGADEFTIKIYLPITLK